MFDIQTGGGGNKYRLGRYERVRWRRKEAGRLAAAFAVPPRTIVAEGWIKLRDGFLEIRTKELPNVQTTVSDLTLGSDLEQ